MPSLRDEYIQAQMEVNFRQWLAKAALFGSLLVVITGFLDYLVAREVFVRSFLYRLGIAGFLLAGYWLNRRIPPARVAAPLAVLWVAIITLFLEFTILSQTGSEVRYVIGNIVLTIVVIGFLPARLSYVMVMAVTMFGLFLLPIALGAVELPHFNIALVSSYLLIIHVSLLLMRYLSEKSIHQELGMKFDLDQYRNGLEAQVADRTKELARTVESLRREMAERQKAENRHEALQEQFLQAQKLESVGRLAGGVAHDINNILTTILSANTLAQMKLPSEHPAHEYLAMVGEAGDRAAGVTRQLLAFSRKQVLELKVVDLNDVVGGIMKMLVRMIGEDVQLEFRPGGSLRSVKADISQIEQVVMNLVVNARDAMPDGGQIVIETANADRPVVQAGNAAGFPQAASVRLSVVDKGCGMTDEVRRSIFEPFFTTKATGKGTGLGLATVYGIVMQHQGHVLVDSAPGRGTAFHIYLPNVAAQAAEEPVQETELLPRGTEAILLAEDDALICSLTTEFLTSLGYTVLAASSGDEALRKSSDRGRSIDLLLTDVVMPGMNGRMLAEALRRTRPSMKVVYMSGYTDDKLNDHGVLGQSVTLIEKPLRLDVLARTLRSVLDASGMPRRGEQQASAPGPVAESPPF